MATLRVGFDDQIFVAQPRGGFSKYFVELIKRLPEHDIEPVLLPRWTRNLHLGESGLVPRSGEQGSLARRRDWFTWRLIGQPRAQAKTLPPLDVMHHTFSHPAYLRSWSGPRVFTVVDMTPELFPHLFKLGNPHLAKKAYCASADAIVSISDSTADDLARLYGEALRAKTTTIYFGIGEEFLRGDTERRLDLPDRYGLFVGVRSGYKDFATAVATMARVRSVEAHRDLRFVVVGGGPLTAAESALLAGHGLADDTTHLRPSDSEMPEVYRRAEVFLFPSHYEGFGMPTLEALASGTPTVLADASCSREVGGALARYAPVADVDAWTAQTLEALTRDAQDEVRVNGPAYAGRFTWSETARHHAAIYREVADRARRT